MMLFASIRATCPATSADRLGASWYDDAIGYLQRSRHFPELAQASGDFANAMYAAYA